METKETVYRSVPIIIEDQGGFSKSGQAWREIKVTMQDGTIGHHYFPADVEPGFQKGVRTCYTKAEQSGKKTKLRPFDATEFDRQRMIVRQSAIGYALQFTGLAGGGERGITVQGILELAEIFEQNVYRP
jgi:hypothetical protein